MTRKLIIWMIALILLVTAVQGALSDDLQTCYTMDDADISGSDILDQEGSNDGAFTGVTTGVSGIILESFLFSGTDNIVSASNSGISGAGTRTVNIWVNYTGGASNYVSCIGSTGIRNWFAMIIDASHEFAFSSYADDYNTGSTITQNVWTMLTATYDGTYVRTYVNGVETSTSNQSKALTTTASSIYIGDRCDLNGDNFDGAIDEYAIWDVVKTDAEITALYNGGSPPGCPYSGVTPTTDIDFTITDSWNGSSILTFNTTISWPNGTTTEHTTTNGTVSLVNVSNTGTLNVTYHTMTDYFNKTLLNEAFTANTSNTITTTTYQAVVCFNATQKVNEAWLTLDNYTIGSNVTTDCFNITAGVHNVLAQKAGWYPQNQTFTVTALSNTTKTVQNMSYANLTIYVIDGTTNESLSGYDINLNSISNPTFGESASGVTNHSMYLINDTYNVTVYKAGYAITTASANITVAGATNYTFTLYRSNSVSITILDEITGDPILSNITVRWTSNLSTWENVTSTSTMFVANLTPANYTLLFYGSNYSTRTYTLTVGNLSTQFLTAYMISSTYSTIFTVKDQDTGDVMSDVGFTMSKLVNSTWTVVESKTTDITGKVQVFYDPIGNYRLSLTKTDYEPLVFYLNPILFSTYDVFMVKGSLLNYTVDYDDISILYGPQSFNNNDNTSFNFLIASPDGLLTTYGITLTYPGGVSTASGVNAIGEQLSVWVNVSGATRWDRVKLEYNYTTSIAGTRTFTQYLSLNTNATASENTWTANKDRTFGLGLFERVLIVTIIVIFAVGIATMVGQPIPGMAIGLFLFGFMVTIGFIPIWSILPSMFIGFLFLVWKSGGY